MAEVAGLVLGCVPLVILALEKLAEPFEAYSDYRMSIDTFRSDLVLQKRQLQTTFSNIGLSGKLTMDDVRECFERQFPDISAELMSIVQRMNQLMTDLLKELDVDVKGRPKLLSERLQWERRRAKHSVNIKRRNKIIEDLRHWNQDLKGCLEKTEVPAEDESRKVQGLKGLFSPKHCDDLRQSLSSLHSALGSGFTCDCSGRSHEAAIDLDWEFYESAAEPLKVAISYSAESHPAKSENPHAWRKLHVVPEAGPEVTTTPEALNHWLPTPEATPKGTRSPESSFTKTSVPQLVSKTAPVPSEPSTAATTLALGKLTIAPNVAICAKNICAAVRVNRDPSTIAGFIKDDYQGKHFSLRHSGELHEITKRIPIKSLLAPAGGPMQRRRWPMLSAKQRYGLAVAMAWSVLHLGDGPWLKDLWDQEQMSVLVESDGRHEVLCRHPCASYTFFPPSSGKGVAEQTLVADSFYNHISQKTIMSLGVLLVELCINEPISGTVSVLDVQNVAQSRLEDVYCLAGDSYGWATARCIKFAFEGRESYNQFCFASFRQQFHNEVIAPLKATYEMFPETASLVG